MNRFPKYTDIAVAFAGLAVALIADYVLTFSYSGYLALLFYAIAYVAVGGPVWMKAWESFRNGTLFSEFFLMGIATAGAFALGEYAEGVAVMLFYMIGENVQHGAVHRARNSIRKLINEQPEKAEVERNGTTEEVHPSEVNPGEIIRVKPGAKVPLDGVLLSERSSFNTAALTGESVPVTRKEGEEVWAGSINTEVPVLIRVSTRFKDSKLAGILNMVQEAAARKAPTQRFMTRFARIYTPAVVWIAVALTFIPYFFTDPYLFSEWFYRALIFLVISCPCGLVISIPLGYFGGIGAASRNGILLKGSDFLDRLRKLDTLFLDKTGTLTEGVFEVSGIQTHNGMEEAEVLKYAAALEQHSTHPVARAVLKKINGQFVPDADQQKELAGKGITGSVEGRQVLAGNRKLMSEYGVTLSDADLSTGSTEVLVAVDGKHTGTIRIADKLRSDSNTLIKELHKRGVKHITMLSGDNEQVVSNTAEGLGISSAYGNLLPEDKYRLVEAALAKDKTVGFVGDGLNDAPVITLADIGIAMGGIGSDATIDTADVVIQTDHPSRLVTAIDISRFTHRIVWQNIILALGIKAAVMVLAAYGLASMWEAVFADVGVALLAVFNAVRIQHKFSPDGSFFSFLSSSDTGEADNDSSENTQSSCCSECC